MKGSEVLRVALGSCSETLKPLEGAAFILQHRPIRDLDALELEVLNHLAAVEDLLAHVRRMQYVHRDPACECLPGTTYTFCPVHGVLAAS